VFAAFGCGWLFSKVHIKHNRSSSSGWFDLSSLDPIAFIIQDVFYALLFAVGMALVCLIVSQFLKPIPPAYGRQMTIGFAFAGLIAHTLSWLLPDMKDAQVVAERTQVSNAEVSKETARINQMFDHMGWVRYPRINTKSPILSGGFGRTRTEMFLAFGDDTDTVFNYYLSRAEQWEYRVPILTVRVSNEGNVFDVELRTDSENMGRIRPGYLAERDYANKGPARWPLSEPEGKIDYRKELTPEDKAELNAQMAKIKYPNGTISAYQGVATVTTTDSMSTVLSFYRQQGWPQMDQNPDDAPSHEFEGVFNNDKIEISITTDGDKVLVSTHTKR
jgi:hypothetical protein